MGYEAEVIRGFNEYCQEKRRLVSEIADGEQRARQEKVLVARSLLHHESEQMLSVYAKYTMIVEERGDSDDRQFQSLQDTSFNKWKVNLTDAVCQVQASEQVRRLPRFSKACGKVQDSLDIDFSDIEDELKMIFEPECIYNTLVLLVTAVKSYCELLDRICERQKG